jgi:hypothetical protein
VLLQIPGPRTGDVLAARPRRQAAAMARPLASGRGDQPLAVGLRAQVAVAAALRQLPSGTQLVIRDMVGREWCVSPARPAAAIERWEAA